MKKVLLVALILVAVGVLLLAVGLAKNGFRPQAETDADLTEKTVLPEGEFSEISVNNGFYAVKIVPSEDGLTRAVFDENEKITVEVTVENGVLRVRQKDLRKWYERIGWVSFGKRRLTLSLPEKTYGKLTVKSGSGSVEITTAYAFGNVSFDISSGSLSAVGLTADGLRLDISSGSAAISDALVNGAFSVDVSSGSAQISGVRAAALSADLSSGKTTFSDVVATGRAEIDVSSGTMLLNDFDAETIDMDLSSGTVKGSLLSAKNFDTHASSGKITVPASDPTAGLCKIRVSSGSVTLSMKE